MIIVAIITIIILQNKVEANSYSIENMNIKATIKEDGSVDVEQMLEYKFNGKYNGIYITIPYNKDDKEYTEVIKNNMEKEK